jgi:hypothetical protein
LVAGAVGASMIIPTLLWAFAQRLWKREASSAPDK